MRGFLCMYVHVCVWSCRRMLGCFIAVYSYDSLPVLLQQHMTATSCQWVATTEREITVHPADTPHRALSSALKASQGLYGGGNHMTQGWNLMFSLIHSAWKGLSHVYFCAFVMPLLESIRGWTDDRNEGREMGKNGPNLQIKCGLWLLSNQHASVWDPSHQTQIILTYSEANWAIMRKQTFTAKKQHTFNIKCESKQINPLSYTQPKWTFASML